ncbi:MAG TPA: chemotaxis-specific protein-glutamate methyltransferase CheB [Chromatiales bacterium]|nr:chemotaxis-specific protein-glutamate methyltransferase CheB [Chromatiales bacterium]
MTIKVLVVDDSALMRKVLREILTAEPGFEVETARDGEDALERIRELDPDVVTLDINMPRMDGLTCLAHIMSESPRPVVMVSSLTEQGALATFEALELGAVDYVAKPGGTVSLNLREVADEIRAKVRAAAGARTRRRAGAAAAPARPAPARPARRAGARAAARRPAGRGDGTGLVLVGVSTGGPGTLEVILTALPEDFPWPVLVAQHMPARFTRVFAERLDRRCALAVREVQRAMPLEPGQIAIAQGDADVLVQRRLGRTTAVTTDPDESLLWHPSVERMVRSALEACPPERLVGVQLTGMGYDGAEAMAELHRRGGRTIAESEESAVVFGMPRELIERGGADVVLPRERIAAQLCEWLMGAPEAAQATGG